LLGERRLTDAERNTIVRWVQGGAPEGEGPLAATTSRPAPAAPLGDDAATFAAYDVPAFGPPYEADFEFRLPAAAVGAGVLGLVATTDAAETVKRVVLRRARDGALLGASTPEGPALRVPYDGPGPARYAWRCAPEEVFRATASLRPNGLATKVRLTIRRFAAPIDAATAEPITRRFAVAEGVVPAGEARAAATAEGVLESPLRLIALLPEARFLAVEAHAVAHLPDGKVRRLAGTSFWDPRLRALWAPVEPFPMPAGTRMSFTVRYDNTEANRRNPARPPRDVRFGPGLDEEACSLEAVFIGP
jgi:hypothetical protein